MKIPLQDGREYLDMMRIGRREFVESTVLPGFMSSQDPLLKQKIGSLDLNYEASTENLMSGTKSKIKKTMKIVGISLGVIVVLGIASLTLVYKMETRPFPVESLECKDGGLSGNWGMGKATSFQVRVTNTEPFGVRNIRFRIDFYDKDKKPIDGTSITIYQNIPPRSTRFLRYEYLAIVGLPPKDQWSWTYSIIGATRTWIFG
jgi:hypothetical protein